MKDSRQRVLTDAQVKKVKRLKKSGASAEWIRRNHFPFASIMTIYRAVKRGEK